MFAISAKISTGLPGQNPWSSEVCNERKVHAAIEVKNMYELFICLSYNGKLGTNLYKV